MNQMLNRQARRALKCGEASYTLGDEEVTVKIDFGSLREASQIMPELKKFNLNFIDPDHANFDIFKTAEIVALLTVEDVDAAEIFTAITEGNDKPIEAFFTAFAEMMPKEQPKGGSSGKPARGRKKKITS